VGCYRPVSPEELPALLVDDAGTSHAGSTPMGKVRPEVRARFLRELQQRLPAAYLDVIRETHETSIQAVFTERVDRYTQGRLCVIGDAGTIFPPYAGSGVLKAVGNALSLAASLATVGPMDDIGAALSEWSDQQLSTDASLAEQSHRNSRLLASQVQELEAFRTEAVLAWINEVHPGAPAFSDA
jgi:2-polyprenyl-6-methoxyphenol hydroxylase-like FAD-dependent oxidoreductase